MTGVELTVTAGRHSRFTRDALPEQSLEAFRRSDVLGALWGRSWLSVFATDGTATMLHVAVLQPIGSTGHSDVEQWLGYAGPVFQGADEAFVASAMEAYVAEMRARRVVAELIRFDPLLDDPAPVAATGLVRVLPSRTVAYVPVETDPAAQQRHYSPACRGRLRRGLKDLAFVDLGRSRAGWLDFRALHETSLARVGAESRWRLSDAVFERLRRTPRTSIWGVRTPQGELVAAALLVLGRRVGTLLLMANGGVPARPGAGELLTHGLTRVLAGGGQRWLCLGGGRSDSPTDSLLSFKAKFSGGHLRRLRLGVLVHDPVALDMLNQQTAGSVAPTAGSQPSGEVVAGIMRYRFAPELRLCSP